MEQSFHRFTELFAQLGLPMDEASIRHFLKTHAPIAPEVLLADVPHMLPNWDAKCSQINS